jgi:hypothetical protein
MLKILDKANLPLKKAMRQRIINHKAEELVYVGAYLANLKTKLSNFKGVLTEGKIN